MKRFFDLSVSFLGLLFLFPFFFIIAILIKLDSKGKIFYLQERVGKNGRIFKIFKFRTMVANADKKGLLSLGKKDTRITKIGHFLRKYKLDELPQLINVFLGDMSFVGPRPEVEKFVKLYSEEEKEILAIKPGITDYASLKFIDEEQILGKSQNPERVYIEEIMPKKIALNKKYLREISVITDVKIILRTVFKILR